MNNYERIYAVVNTIPHGYIASYAQVGRAVGLRNGARMVGWAMRALPPGSQTPWWRVVNSKRQISIINPRIPKTEQMRLLAEEGLLIEEKAGWLVVAGDIWAEL